MYRKASVEKSSSLSDVSGVEVKTVAVARRCVVAVVKVTVTSFCTKPSAPMIAELEVERCEVLFGVTCRTGGIMWES